MKSWIIANCLKSVYDVKEQVVSKVTPRYKYMKLNILAMTPYSISRIHDVKYMLQCYA